MSRKINVSDKESRERSDACLTNPISYEDELPLSSTSQSVCQLFGVPPQQWSLQLKAKQILFFLKQYLNEQTFQ